MTTAQAEDILKDGEVTDAVEKAAKRLVGKAGFLAADLDDLRQELWREILLRLPGYSPNRGTIIAYIHIIIQSKVKNLVSYQKAKKRDYRRRGPSLDTESFSEDGRSTTLGERLAQGEDRRNTGERTGHEPTDLKIDVDEVLREAPTQVRSLCEGIRAGKSKSEVARDHGVTTGTVRNRLARLREPLRAIYRDYVHSKKDGYDTFSGVTHDERDEALAVSSTRTCLHEPSLDPMLAGRVPEA